MALKLRTGGSKGAGIIRKKIKCVKEPDNLYDGEAIKATMKQIGTVGYVANSPYTVATGTKSAGWIAHKVKKKFTVEVMFITRTKVICKVIDGFKEKKRVDLGEEEAGIPRECEIAR